MPSMLEFARPPNSSSMTIRKTRTDRNPRIKGPEMWSLHRPDHECLFGAGLSGETKVTETFVDPEKRFWHPSVLKGEFKRNRKGSKIKMKIKTRKRTETKLRAG